MEMLRIRHVTTISNRFRGTVTGPSMSCMHMRSVILGTVRLNLTSRILSLVYYKQLSWLSIFCKQASYYLYYSWRRAPWASPQEQARSIASTSSIAVALVIHELHKIIVFSSGTLHLCNLKAPTLAHEPVRHHFLPSIFLQSGQNHLTLLPGGSFRPTHPKWNHSRSH